jgi:hypothetical protein
LKYSPPGAFSLVRREEVPATVPVLLVTSDQAQIGLVDQRRGVERLARLLPRQLLRRQFAEFVVDQRQELRGGGRVALLDGGQEVSDFAQAVQDNHPDGGSQQAADRRGGQEQGPERFRGPSEPPADVAQIELLAPLGRQRVEAGHPCPPSDDPGWPNGPPEV